MSTATPAVPAAPVPIRPPREGGVQAKRTGTRIFLLVFACLLYTSDAADERSSVDLGGRRIIKKKTSMESHRLAGNVAHRQMYVD